MQNNERNKKTFRMSDQLLLGLFWGQMGFTHY